MQTSIYKAKENLGMGLGAIQTLGIKKIGVGYDNFINKDAHLVLTIIW